MRKCVNCGHQVSQGDRHAKSACPPPALGSSSQKARKKRKARRAMRKDAALNPPRGMAVAGTGVPKGSTK